MGWGREAVEDGGRVREREREEVEEIFLDEDLDLDLDLGLDLEEDLEEDLGLGLDLEEDLGLDLGLGLDLEMAEVWGGVEAAMVVVGGRRRPVRRQRARRNLVGRGKFKVVRIWVRGRRSRDKNRGYLGETEEGGVELLCVRG